MDEGVWFADDVLIEFHNDDQVAKNKYLVDFIRNTPACDFTVEGDKSSFFIHRYNFAHLMHMLFLNCNDPIINVIRADFNFAQPFETSEGMYNTQQVTISQVAR